MTIDPYVTERRALVDAVIQGRGVPPAALFAGTWPTMRDRGYRF